MNILSKIFICTGITIIPLLISSCATLTSDIVIESHFASEVNFNNYKSYSWAGSSKIVFDPIGQWKQPTLDTEDEVKLNISRELHDKGLIEVHNKPDLLVAFSAGIDITYLELIENPDSKEKILTNVPKAALVIALVDANTGYTVWMGTAEGDMQQQQNIENIRARIKYAVSEIFSDYND
ncbi:MAG: DUF4136 domain-containing protein [Gammaproteobacteria bacterium]|nr:DUF4136 domain-containing protein [Gammaproteobacteria bacterium]